MTTLMGYWHTGRNIGTLAKCYLRPVHGLNAEATPEGDMFLLADSDGRYLDNITADSVLEFLFDAKYQKAYNVFSIYIMTP